MLSVAKVNVADDWALTTDVAPSGLSIGDIVTRAASSVTGTYGVDAFGSVTSHGTVSGAATIANAIAATSPGGSTSVLHGAFTENVDVNKTILFVNPNNLNGDYSLSDAGAAISTGSTPHTVAISGDLDLDDGTFLAAIDSSGTTDRYNVSGTINLSGAKLKVQFADLDAATNTTYTIIHGVNNAVTGTFDGLADGATFQEGGRTLRINYNPGGSKDVVITALAATQSLPFVSYVNDNWNIVVDLGTVGLSAGDPVDDSLQNSPPTLSFNFEELNGPVTDGYYESAFDDLATAIAGTAQGGIIKIIEPPSGGYTGNVTIDRALAVEGAFSVSGDLTVDSGAVLSAGSSSGDYSIGDDLTLAAGSRLQMRLNAFDSMNSPFSDQLTVAGDITLTGAILDASISSSTATPGASFTLIKNEANSAVTGTFAGLPEGAVVLVGRETFRITYQGVRDVSHTHDVVLIPASTVVGRHLFYNDSHYDGNNSAMNSSDDVAIADIPGDPNSKLALLPGEKASIKNLSSYSEGINGIMVDIDGANSGISASDFLFHVGRNNNPASWSALGTTPSVTVRAGAGAGSSDRVELTWPNGTITQNWLKVTVLANSNTGLAKPDEFYFGSLIGDYGGDSANFAVTNTNDELGARNHHQSLFNNIPTTYPYDYNRDGQVNTADELIARNNVTSPFFMPYISTASAQLTGPSTLTPGVPATFAISLPMVRVNGLPQPDTSVTGVDLYQDVNGNGLKDSGDVLLISTTQQFADDGNSNSIPAGWAGVVDPSDFTAGATAVVAVLRNSGGITATAGSMAGFAIPPSIPSQIVMVVDTTQSWLTATAVAGIGANTVVSTTPTPQLNLALAGAVIGGNGPNTVGVASGSASNQWMDGGPVGEVFADSSASAGATWIAGQPVLYGGTGTYTGNVVFQITSPTLPIGTPIRIRSSVAAFASGSGGPVTNPWSGGAGGSMSLSSANSSGPSRILGTAANPTIIGVGAPTGITATEVIPLVVGGWVSVRFLGNFNESVAFALPGPGVPLSDWVDGSFFDFVVTGV